MTRKSIFQARLKPFHERILIQTDVINYNCRRHVINYYPNV